nr:MAG TPA: hypothetical protein [Caudoviricetes sp.]
MYQVINKVTSLLEVNFLTNYHHNPPYTRSLLSL